MQLFNVEAIVFTKQKFFLTPKAWKNRPHNRPNFFLRTGTEVFQPSKYVKVTPCVYTTVFIVQL